MYTCVVRIHMCMYCMHVLFLASALTLIPFSEIIYIYMLYIYPDTQLRMDVSKVQLRKSKKTAGQPKKTIIYIYIYMCVHMYIYITGIQETLGLKLL